MPERFDVDSLDLAELAGALSRALGGRPVEGAVAGRTSLRDAVVEQLGCSLLQGELVVDTMVGRGFLSLEHRRDGSEVWHIRRPSG